MQLHRFREEFEKRRTRILLIGFEKEHRSREWMHRAKVDFPFLIDRDRALYQAYGVERSILRAWRPRVLCFYFKRLLRGKGIPIFRADPSQLGGDILIDPDGFIRYIFKSRDSMDRPSVKELLAAIDRTH